MLPSSQAPSQVRSPGLHFSQPPDSRPGAENQHTRNSLGFQLWALHAEPPPPAPLQLQNKSTRLPCSSALQPSPETWEQEPGASVCPTAPHQGHYRALGQGPLISCPPKDRKGQENRSPTVAQHSWSLLPSSVRGADSIPKGLWSRGKEEPSRGLRVALGLGVPTRCGRRRGPCPV